MPATAPPDRLPDELLERLRDGDADAVDGFFRGQHAAVYRLCLGFLANTAEAEDAAQDGVLRLLDQLGHYDAARPFTAWRNTVILNLCRGRRRAQSRRREAESAAAAARTAAAPRPHPSLEQDELRHALTAALGSLPEREREAFVLRDLEEQDTAAVAEAMGIGESSVRSLTTLARQRLRTLLTDRLDPTQRPGGGTRD